MSYSTQLGIPDWHTTNPDYTPWEEEEDDEEIDEDDIEEE